MKSIFLGLNPHRELPSNFESEYESVWVTPPYHKLVQGDQMHRSYSSTLNESIHAAECGFDGVAFNEHHQSAFGGTPNPNMLGAVLAYATNHLRTAVVQMGSTIPLVPAQRVAEEYAMIDVISNGRLIAGMPLGTPMDGNMGYGIPPMESRERYQEGHDLILKAWSTPEAFSWNGKYNKLRTVNLWPRPVQTPPPVWVPGIGSPSTWDFAARNGHAYAFLSFYGAEFSQTAINGYWDFMEKNGHDLNPFRMGFIQLIGIADTDAEAEKIYEPHIRYFYDKSGHFPPHWYGPPGYNDYRSLVASTRAGGLEKLKGLAARMQTMSVREMTESGMVIVGSADTVAERLEEMCRRFNIGNLFCMMQYGSMPSEVVDRNVELYTSKVQPKIRNLWEGDHEHHWWPQRLREPKPAPLVSV